MCLLRHPMNGKSEAIYRTFSSQAIFDLELSVKINMC